MRGGEYWFNGRLCAFSRDIGPTRQPKQLLEIDADGSPGRGQVVVDRIHGHPWIVGADVPTFVRNYSGTVIATLLGDRGGRMRCRFRLAEPEQGMSGGGVGECEASGGGKIDATF